MTGITGAVGSRRGQAGVTMALTLTLLFSLIGFSVDLGLSYYQKQSAQAAADAAAISAAVAAKSMGTTCGSNGLVCNSTPTACTAITTGAFNVGCQYATQNGFAASTVSMSGNTTTPASAPGTTPAYWVKASIASTHRNYFLGFAGFSSSTIAAESTAGVYGGSSGGQNCFIALGSGKGTLFVTGGSTIALHSCTGQVNSSADDQTNYQPSNTAVNINGGSTVTGNVVNVVGGELNGSGVSNYCQAPFNCHKPVVADPLSSVRAFNPLTDLSPGVSGCSQSSMPTITSNTTLTPGVYCGGIHISGGTTTFQPGYYVIKDGGLTIDNGTATGTNVMFYMTSSNTQTTTDALVTINVNVTFSAPSSGPFRGILFYGDRSAPLDSTGNYNSIQASATPNLSGTMYFPTGNIKLTGSSGLAGYIAIIAQRIDVEGNSSFTWDSTGTLTGLASAPAVYLIE